MFLKTIKSHIKSHFVIIIMLQPEYTKLSSSQIEFLLSMIELPSFSLGLSQEDVAAHDNTLTNIPPLVANEDIAETRKSKRTRTLPPIFNDYMCDPKIKAFRSEENIPTNDRNVDEIYLSMREKIVDNQ